jgi:MFS family permease
LAPAAACVGFETNKCACPPALALGIGGSFSGLGGILNSVLSPYFADAFGVSFALWFGAIACAGSMMATAVLIPIDRAAQLACPHTLPNGQPRVQLQSSSIKLGDIKHFGSVFWLILVACVSVWGSIIPFQTVAGSMLMERDYFRAPPLECQRCGDGNYASYTNCHEIVPSCPPFPPYAWPLPKMAASCDITREADQLNCKTDAPYIEDSAINCDNLMWKTGPLTQLYCAKKILAEEEASNVMSLPSMITLIASPIFGYVAGRIPDRGWITLLASGCLVVSQFLIATTSVSIWTLLFVQGAASCLFFSSAWPSIPCTWRSAASSSDQI